MSSALNMTPLTDTRGTTLEPDQEVVCNVSGQLARGVIVDIRTSYRYSRPCWTIHVKLHHSAAGQSAGHVTKATDPRNVLALKDGER